MRRKLLASLLAIVMVISLVPATVLAADFADTNGHWGEAAIDRWADVGILNGKGEGNFDPDGSMTRAEFAQMLATMMGYTARVPNNFTDVPAGAWYEDAMLKLVAAGVLSGNGDGTATPNDPITREQAAVLLCRAFNLEPSRNASLNYQDSASISSWARDAMAALAERGMMSGVGDNTAAPQLNINRASVATLADNMIAEYVTESKTITGNVDGIILVAGGASVNLDNATISEPVIIAPKASGVSVNLTGSTRADDIVIEANSARVSVGANASASSVKAESNSASVSVAGTVSSVDVTGSNGKVTVTGSVGTVSTEATGTSITVSGTVTNVDIGANAGRASVTASAGGKIDSVTTEASNVTVSGNGTVGSVTATGGSVDVTTKGTEVKNDGANKVTAGDKTVASGKTETSTGGSTSSGGDSNDDSSTGTVTPEGPGGSGGQSSSLPYGGKNEAGLIAAPLVDHFNDQSNDANIPNPGSFRVYSEKVNAPATAAEGGTTETTYNVTIVGTSPIVNHTNTDLENGHWVGIGIPLEEGTEYQVSACTVLESGLFGTDELLDEDRTVEQGGKTYCTVYFSEKEVGVNDYDAFRVTVTDSEFTQMIKYNVEAITVDFWKASSVRVSDSLADEENTPALNAAGTGITTVTYPSREADSKWTITLNGSLDPDLLANSEGCVYYNIKATGEHISWIEADEAGIVDATQTGKTMDAAKGVDVKVKIYDADSDTVCAPVTQRFELRDNNQRVQDIITVYIDTTNCGIVGKVKVIYDTGKEDGNKTAMVDVGTPFTPSAEVPDNDTAVNGKYYTGEWLLNGQPLDLDENGQYTIAEGTASTITLTPRYLTIAAQDFQERDPEGPNDSRPDDLVDSFNYATAYDNAGLSISEGLITFDLKNLKAITDDPTLPCAAESDHEDNYKHLFGKGGSNLAYGVVFNKPADAENATMVAHVENNESWTGSHTVPDNEWIVNITLADSENVIGHKYLKYYTVATAVTTANGSTTVTTRENKAAGDEPITIDNGYYLWLNDQKQVLAVTSANLQLQIVDTTPSADQPVVP